MAKSYVYRRILIIALLLTAFSLLYAVFISQDKKFSGQVPLFPAELNSLVSDKVKEQEEVFLKGFPAFWLSDTIEISKKEAIIGTANQILEVLPDDKSYILSYVKLIADFYRNQYAKNQFETWFSYLNTALADGFIKSDNLRTLIRFSGSLIDSSFISINTSHTWKVLPANSYTFTLKNNDLLVNFQNINLICRNNRTDSIFIRGTSGNLDIIKQSWEGKNGKVTWIRSKFDESKIFVALNRYRIELRQSEYTADSVLLNYPEYFKKPILGRIVDKVTPIYQSGIVDYPEFNPYQKWFEVKNIFKDVDYSGNFSITGSKLVGIGPDGGLAKVTVHRKGKPFMVAEGRMVLIEQSRLSSDKAKVVFYIDKDSIYHNGLSFAYHNPTRTVMVNPTDRLTTQSPFYSSYHKINLWSNQLTWSIEKDEITFGSSLGASISKAEFKSENFFNQDLFDSMMDASEFHPVLTVWNYTRRIKSNTFLASDLAVHVRRAPEEVKIAMMRLAKLGYVLYNFETDEVTITDKLKYNVMARFGRTDFDVIRFQSTTPGTQPNARLDLNNLNLAIEGVNYISVSDSQNVFISPYKKSIIFQKNRNFEFGGSVRAGLFTFYGKAFRFDYSQFKVELNKVDSLIIDYQTEYRDNYGRRILQGVDNALHIISGDILIDKPYNKSGREYNP
ncbi:MAG: hypothetical protein H5T24_07065, partial [Bacteroidales bacterium]|nr:hypothetical protein [Bacteroidales bacterium]